MTSTYGGPGRSSPQSYASDGTKITHNYTITHLDSFGKVAKVEWYETPYGKPFGLGWNQHIGTYYPKIGIYEPTVDGYPDANAYGSSEIGKSNIMSLAQQSTKDTIQETLTNNNPNNLTAQEITTQSIQESRDIFNLNSTVATAPQTTTTNNNTGDTPAVPPGENPGDDAINTANYNNTYHPTNIMDAGGTASTHPGNMDRPLKYPLKHLSAYDFIKIYPMEYQPAFDTDGGYDSSTISNVKGRYGSHKVGSMVYLPMIPAGETSSTGWGEDRMNAIQKEFGKAASDAIKNAYGNEDESGNIVDWAKNFGGSLFGAANNLTGNGVRQFITAYFAGKAVGANILGRSGVAINPNLELLFSGPSLRSFSYNFRFTPREPAEAREIRDIIKVFKKGMAPRRTEGNVFLKVPFVWKLKYIKGNDAQNSIGNYDQHPYLNKIKPCALKSFNVNYMPDGSYMTYAGSGVGKGSMTSYQVSMEFGELEPIYNNDIDMTKDDMGY